MWIFFLFLFHSIFFCFTVNWKQIWEKFESSMRVSVFKGNSSKIGRYKNSRISGKILPRSAFGFAFPFSTRIRENFHNLTRKFSVANSACIIFKEMRWKLGPNKLWLSGLLSGKVEPARPAADEDPFFFQRFFPLRNAKYAKKLWK